MSRLIGAELNRWFSRRLIWVVMLAGALLAVLVIAGAAYGTRPMSAAELASAEQQYADAMKELEQEAADCEQSGTSPQDCDLWTPQREDFIRQPPAYAEFAGALAQVGTMVAAYAALLAGASFIGAEFKTGNLGTWLTYVPSRMSVLASKAVAAALGTAVLGLVVVGLLQAGAAAIVLAWSGAGALQPAPEAWAMAGRGLLLTLIAGLVGFALAALFGSTIGPVGALLGVMVLQWAVGLLALLLGASAWLQLALPDPNLQAFLNGSTEISYLELSATGEPVDRTVELGLAQASAYLVGLLVLLSAAATWRFARREIR